MSLRPPKDKRSISMNEIAGSSISSSKRPLPTPFLRQPSVVEVMEKKQREGLKNRLKMLHTGVLPSRNPAPSNLPVIVKAPVRRESLPKNLPRKAHYRSVLTLAQDPDSPTEGEQSRLTRRHSVGGLIVSYRDKERSTSLTDNKGFKSKDFNTDRYSGNRYKNASTDKKKPSSDSDSKPRAKFLIAKDDSDFDKHSSVTFQPITTTKNEKPTHSSLTEEDEHAVTLDSEMNGNQKKHENDDDVFGATRTDADLDENLNVKQSNKDHDLKENDEKKSDTDDCLVNGHHEVTEKIDGIGDDIVETMKTIHRTDSPESPRVTEESWMSESTMHRDGETTHIKQIKEPESLFTTETKSSILVDINDSSSASPSHNHDLNDEVRVENPQHPPSLVLTTFPGFESSYVTQTETYATFREVENNKVDERPVSPEEHQSIRNDDAISRIKVLTTSGRHDSSVQMKELNKSDDKAKGETDTFWSSVEESFRHPVQTIATESRSERIEIEDPNWPDTGLGKHDFFNDSKETTKHDERGKADNPWAAFEDLSTASDQASSKSHSEPFELEVQQINLDTGLNKHDFSNELKELSWHDYENIPKISAFEDSFTDPIETTSNKSISELVQKSPDSGLGKHNFSDELKELNWNDNKNVPKTGGLLSTSEDSFTGPIETTSNKSHSELVQKSPDSGLDKHDFSDELKELNWNENENIPKLSTFEDSFTGPIETTSSKYSSESMKGEVQKCPDSGFGEHDISDDSQNEENSKNKSDASVDSLTVQTSIKSCPDSLDVAEQKGSDAVVLDKHNTSDVSTEPSKNDIKGTDRTDGFWSVVEESFAGSVQATPVKSRSELIEVEVQKCPDAGLGFCIEGGLGSTLGDRPVTVKRVFNAATYRCLKEGDEILTVNSVDTSTLTHIDAWTLFKSLPEGPVKMTIIRRMDD